MPTTRDPDAFAAQGERLYAQRIKAIVEPAHIGEYLAIEVASGDYFLDRAFVKAVMKAHAAYPERRFYFIKIDDAAEEVAAVGEWIAERHTNDLLPHETGVKPASEFLDDLL